MNTIIYALLFVAHVAVFGAIAYFLIANAIGE